jgi:hypothetical protein
MRQAICLELGPKKIRRPFRVWAIIKMGFEPIQFFKENTDKL